MISGTVIRDVPYGGAHPRHVGDLFLPAYPRPDTQPVLLIHGGGWNALTKETLEPVARLAAAEGLTVFSINYRLLDHAPWPACGDDCLTAARFMLAGGLTSQGLPAPRSGRLLVAGASAGGHLALMTGLALGNRACSGILSMAGPTRLDPRNDTSKSAILQPGFLQKFFGRAQPPSASELLAVSPTALVTAAAPPLDILHSRNDRLVPLSHSDEAVAAWRTAGVTARLEIFDGPGDSHGFWSTDDLATRELIPDLARRLITIFATISP